MTASDVPPDAAARAAPAAASLPPLLTGRRRTMVALLVCAGLGQAALAGVTALSMPRLLQATPADRWFWVGVLLLAALCMSGVRVAEWILAEKLGQDYVHQLRRGLLAAALAEGRGPSLGTTIARATNDLAAVRNWIAWGIAPLAGAVPLVAGVLVVLALVHPVLAGAVAVPIVLLVVVFGLLARTAYLRARSVRAARGRLAAQVSDTVAAGTVIRAAGGVRRELGRIAQRSADVRATAVRRAHVAGYLRGAAVGAAAIATLGVVVAGAWTGLEHAVVATTITIVGVLTTPIHDLGRIVEYRQSFLAARRILAPALVTSPPDGRQARTQAPRQGDPGPSGVHVHDLWLDGNRVPGLVAAPGARVVLRSENPEWVDAVIGLLAGTTTAGGRARGWVRVSGQDLGSLAPEERRRYVGFAARGAALERGTIARAVRYRHPASTEPVDRELAAVGLAERVRNLPKGERTTLRRGGEPLSPAERARLQLARACYWRPPLLVLDRIEEQLGAGGADLLRGVLADYPGVVVLATDAAEDIAGEPEVWDLTAAAGERARATSAGFGRDRHRTEGVR
ncbi:MULTISPECIES: ABC transporter transmembrane domain-containing protein [Prauserella salsuginis group]|uniref:ABC transporter transmembrane domain-containing protein n=1 Tax=Prauserella salsuginis TaxID=387889 RepID=A0ABW6G1R9_9PSEU|nr:MULTISPECIES: ABC transporter ATP-binding protein [Prauserella salsuginis group]